MNKQIEKMARFMLEKSNSANATPIFTAEDGTETVLGENMTKVLDAILEQAFIPFLAECLVKEGYRKQIEGEWVYKFNFHGDKFYNCSVCGRQVIINSLCNQERNASEFYPYCHCGAKMKGD